MNVSEEILEKKYAPPNELTAPVAPKAKAKRAPRKQPVAESSPEGSQTKGLKVEPEVEVTARLDEVQAVVTIPTEEKPQEASKVGCPDCGKQISARTFRYSHVPNCTSKKQKQQLPREQPEQNIIDIGIENEVPKRLKSRRVERATRREAMVQKLMQNAFSFSEL